jgi:hypothetical protein
MSLLYIYLSNLRIVSDHIQAAMPQKRLQSKNISTGTQIRNRKGMPKFVGIGIFHLSPGSDALD